MLEYDAIYARQSVDRMDSISIESQIEYCKYEARCIIQSVYFCRNETIYILIEVYYNGNIK